MSRAGDQPEISQSGPAGTPPGSASETATVARSGVSWRALAIGLVLVVIVCFVVCWSELIITRIQIGFLQMPPVAMGLFFFIVLANGQMRKISRRLGLRAAELLMIYCMMVVAAMISSRGVMEKVIPMLVTPNYYANSSNRWQELWYITLPGMRHMLLFSAVMQIAGSFSISSIVQQLAGYPTIGYAADTIVSYLSDVGTVKYEMGYASALSVILFLMMMVTRLITGRLLNKTGR